MLSGLVCIASFSCSLGLRISCIISEGSMGGNPVMFSGSFPGSFEFWRSPEYWGCRASFAWQGESVVYLKHFVPKQLHTLCSVIPSQSFYSISAGTSGSRVTQCIGEQIFKQKCALSEQVNSTLSSILPYGQQFEHHIPEIDGLLLLVSKIFPQAAYALWSKRQWVVLAQLREQPLT